MTKTRQILCTSAAFAALSLAAAPAQAGFQWTPPPAPPASSTGPAVQAVPVPAVEVMSYDSAPAAATDDAALDIDAWPLGPDDGDAAASAPQAEPLPPPATAPSPIMTDVSAAPAPVMTAPVMTAPAAPFTDAVGFGRDIALALAMQQIVPAGYSYAFGDTDPGMTVSWDGGKPWNEVLADAVRPAGLSVTVDGRVVKIGTAPAGLPPVAETVVADTPMPMPAEQPTVEAEAAPVALTAGAVSSPASDTPAPELSDSSYLKISMAEEEEYKPSYPRRLRPEGQDATSGTPVRLDVTAPPVDAPQTTVAVISKAAPEQDLTVPPVRDQAASKKVMDPFEIRFWQAAKGDNLRDILMLWADSAGAELYWGARQDYILPTPVSMHGTFPDAITEVLTAFDKGPGPRPLGRLHPNLPDGPSVLIVDDQTATN